MSCMHSSYLICWPLGLVAWILPLGSWCGEPIIVPGTGVIITAVGDDFEDPTWEYDFRGDKSSRDLDQNARSPAGESLNRRWYEGTKHGHPDVIARVPTPRGGLPGSQGALLLRSLRSGIPGFVTNQVQQDDLVADVSYRVGQSVPVTFCPNVVVRTYLPPIDQWEPRGGTHFAFRCTVELDREGKAEVRWPGLFIAREENPSRADRALFFRIRANRRGQDYQSKYIATTGWWTLGLSLSPDGRLHYFAKPGVSNLTAADLLASEEPYGSRCRSFKTFFFTVCNRDDGHSWSTPWIIDDPTVYYIPTATAAASTVQRR